MQTQIDSNFNRADSLRSGPDARRERARVVASWAEYLAEDVQDHPDRAPAAMKSLAEWCEGDLDLLAQARRDVLRDTTVAQADAAQTNRSAVKLLDLVEQHG